MFRSILSVAVLGLFKIILLTHHGAAEQSKLPPCEAGLIGWIEMIAREAQQAACPHSEFFQNEKIGLARAALHQQLSREFSVQDLDHLRLIAGVDEREISCWSFSKLGVDINGPFLAEKVEREASLQLALATRLKSLPNGFCYEAKKRYRYEGKLP
ncbi:MAG: hypothetical protein AAF393_04965 [Pseudomonadota bacterium]